MHKATDVLGLPVLTVNDGEEIGTIRDILCDKQMCVVGFLLQEHTWMQPGLYVPLDQIRAVGDDYVTIDAQDAISSLCEIAKNDAVGLVTGESKLKGKTVITEDGRYLGRVEDVYFTQKWDKLVAYELSDGWITDVTEGRKRLPAEPSFFISKGNIIVPETTRIMV